jgi:hypothetical protein
MYRNRFVTALLTLTLVLSLSHAALAAYIFIPMDGLQKNHLKAYGIAYHALTKDVEVSWLLNYRGGSFMFQHSKAIENECNIRGISYEIIADVQAAVIRQQVAQPEINQQDIRLNKPPRIAVYTPPNKLPWDDAVTLVLSYAEIPYDAIYDDEVTGGALPTYDWLHLHHEDFTGQHGKFWYSYRNYAWYIEEQRFQEGLARKLGFSKVSQLKLAVSKKIRDFVAGGGYMFAMCSAPDSYDVALAAEGVDICDVMFDGDPMDPNAQQKLNYDNCFAFHNFSLVISPYRYEISDIDVTETRPRTLTQNNDFFTLFDFSAKWDPVPAMLCQNHETTVRGFMGQTTAFNSKLIKSSVLIMGENKPAGEARYIHGEYGNGTWTFYGGHDPEDYQHLVGDPATDLDLFPNSPGYRLILNNVLFPAAKKKKRKT